MARRTFYVIDITEILARWCAGRSQHDVAGSLGANRKTISKHREYIVEMLRAGDTGRSRPASTIV
jgi:hypothetical protein